jgi:hypothetical protein
MADFLGTLALDVTNLTTRQPQAAYLRWLMRISDDMWGAVQLLGLFFLGATILCVPPRYVIPSPAAVFASAPPEAAAASPAHLPVYVASAPLMVPAFIVAVPMAPGEPARSLESAGPHRAATPDSQTP